MVESTTTSLNELIYIFYSGYSGSVEYDKLNNLILALFFYKFERNKYFKEYSEAMNEVKFSKIKQLILNRKK